jgi:hypothetical protein
MHCTCPKLVWLVDAIIDQIVQVRTMYKGDELKKKEKEARERWRERGREWSLSSYWWARYAKFNVECAICTLSCNPVCRAWVGSADQI